VTDAGGEAKVRVGVVGTGVIAQVMHLHFLRELEERYEIAALCDLSEDSARRSAHAYGVPPGHVHTEWRALLSEELDAVLVLTSGSHAAIAVSAAERGMHVFVEKPMCHSVDEGRTMVEAARTAGVTLMVGYPKRYDPAFARFREEVAGVGTPKLLRVTTFESPFQPYLGHYPLYRPASPPGPPTDVAERREESDAALRRALGTSDERLVRAYRSVLLDTLVHEINTVRGALGEPDRVDYADIREGSMTVMLTFGSTPVAIHWLDLPGMTRYLMEFAYFGDERRVTLSFPSPLLRNAPTLLTVEGGTAGNVGSWRTEELTSYHSAFRRELEVFHDAIAGGPPPPTDGVDGLRDIALCTAIISAAKEGRAVDSPTAF
jgi:predicted dehydrogenase